MQTRRKSFPLSRVLFAAPALLVSLTGAAMSPARAQTLTTLATFHGTDGANPNAGLTLSADGKTLYGTAANKVFSVPVSGGNPTTLATLNGPTGTNPEAGLLLSPDGRTLYGTTPGGGTNGTDPNTSGTVFSLPVGGGTPTTLASFSGANGADPQADLALSADGKTLYGTTYYGGTVNIYSAPYGYGTVFSVPVTGGAPTTLAKFSGVNGQWPKGRLTILGGKLYGTTSSGGAYDNGTVFSVPVGGGAITTLTNFTGSNGNTPQGLFPLAGLTLSTDGQVFYGTTSSGGAYGDGTVFSVPVGGGAITTLVNFNGSNGQLPCCRLLLSSDGTTLSGTTEEGGTNGDGTVFSVSVGGGMPATLHNFNGTDGKWPVAGLIPSADGGTVYGITLGGGGSSDGTVFSLTLGGSSAPTWTAVAVSAGAFDGYTRLLWDRSDGTAAVWKVDTQGRLVTEQQFGPYSGWTAKALTTGPDNRSCLLWTNTNGAAAYYLLDANNAFIGQSQYGPYTGWTAQGVAAEPDTSFRTLWTNANGTATVWTLDAATNFVTQQQYGPYAGWTAKSLSTSSSFFGSGLADTSLYGQERLLWTNTDGTATIWHLNSGSQLVGQHQYGPYTGYTAQSAATGIDGTGRVVWGGTDGHVALWSIDASNTYTAQTQFGPYAGWSFQGIAVGSDGNARLLWDNISRQAALWSITPGGAFASNVQFGPY